MTRRALVGFSSPIAYDYEHLATRAPSDLQSSPNPILDSPFGLMLLFDEIVFISRSFCPENMRTLAYVRFLDEEGLFPSSALGDWASAYDAVESSVEWRRAAERVWESSGRRDVVDVIARVTGGLSGSDNHTHDVRVGDFVGRGNADVYNLFRDLLIRDVLADQSLELVTNSFTQRFLEHKRDRVLAEARQTELIVVDNIHNYTAPAGPYHPVIDKLRENSYLSHFRRWIADQPASVSDAELKDIKESVERTLQEAQETAFLKFLDPKTHYVSVGKAVVGDAIGAFLPGAGILMSAAEEVFTHQRLREQKWQGFVVAARRDLRQRTAG